MVVSDFYSDQRMKEEVAGIAMDNLMVLERLRQNQRQDYLQVCDGMDKYSRHPMMSSFFPMSE